MNILAALVAHRLATEAIEPSEGALDHPAIAPEALTRLDAPTGDARGDAAGATCPTTSRVVVCFVGMQLSGTLARTSWSARLAPHRVNGIERLLQHLRVMHVGARKPHAQGDASAVDHNMALRARFAAIRRIRPGRFAPFLAGTLALSRAARDQSNLSASARRCSSSWWRRSHTPARCQSRSRRQQVMPLPQPNSRGNNSQGVPVCNTNRMPASAARSLKRGRPPLGLGGSLGRSGSTTAHNSSLTRGLLMPPV